jgi:hypothetical protein
MYKGKFYLTLGEVTQYGVTSTIPNVQVSVVNNGNTVRFSHPSINEATIANANFIEYLDAEVTLTIASVEGILDVTAYGPNSQYAPHFSFQIVIYP